MKQIYYLVLIAIFTFSHSVQAAIHPMNQASGTIAVQNSAYVNDMSETWDINTGVPKAVKFTFTIDCEEDIDYLLIYNVDNNGVLTLLYQLSGAQSGSITTVLPTGKARVVFVTDFSSCNDDGYTGFTASFSVDNSYYISQDLQVTGKTFLNGNVGIGTSDPQFKLDVKGDIQLNGKLGIGLTDQFTYDSKSFSHYSLGWFSDSWTGNGPTLWQSAWGGMKFFTKGTPRIAINYDGNVGIGTTSPKALLQIGDTYSVPLSTPTVRINALTGASGSVVNAIHIDSNSPDFDKGVAISLGYEHTSYGAYTSRIVHFGDADQTVGSKLQIQTHSKNSNVWNAGLFMDEYGKVSIGTTDNDPTTGVMLTVKGKIHTSEIIVDLNTPLADFVFKPTYKLMPLPEVEQFVKTNNHLPEIPSAAEVSKNGMSIGEMQNKLLQKIEELTLYVIEQQKEINFLKQKFKK